MQLHVCICVSSYNIKLYTILCEIYTRIFDSSQGIQLYSNILSIYKLTTHLYTDAHTQTHTLNESTEVQTLGVIRIQLIYSINVLSKYSSLISHRPSIFEGRHIDHRSSKVNTSISEGRHIDLRRSTQRSSKVDTSIFEGRHIVTSIVYLRKAIHRSSKVATSIFEDRRQKHHTYNSPPNIVHNCPPSP